jgi:hypothetical protein
MQIRKSYKLGENILYQSHVVQFSVCATLEKPIVSIYVVRGFEWLGHVSRMDGERTAKKLLGGKPGGGGGGGNLH